MEECQLIARVARDLADGRIVGWFQGRFEMGPRALGNRSILADPRRPDMRDVLNAKVKQREPFRPFAPAVLVERASEFFEIDQPDPFMTLAPRVRPESRDRIPAAVHVDGTARIQTVERSSNPRYYGLIEAFGRLTGVPILLNTSFNRSEPIVGLPHGRHRMLPQERRGRAGARRFLHHRPSCRPQQPRRRPQRAARPGARSLGEAAMMARTASN